MKKILTLSILALGAVISIQSVHAVAQNKEDRAAVRADKQADIAEKKAEKKEEIAEKKVEKACNRITTRIENMQEKTANREQLASERIDERLAKVQEKRTVRKQELTQRREMRDAQRQAFYDALLEKATTAQQKEAVKKFETTIEEAVKIRRIAIDAAIEKMQADVDALVVEKQNRIDQLFADYKKAEEAAFSKAESACGDTSTETDLKNIAQELNAELKVARENFRTGIRETRTMGTEIQQLADIKRQTVQSAIDTFKQTVQQARVELQNAFGGTVDVDVSFDTVEE